MEIKVVDRQGRVVIPTEMRRKFKMKAGTKVAFIDADDGVVVRVI
ncbi:MAG: AbrB/MazE/SpoVT family DNA-binding domain-containing protein [Ignavibacteriales bacterium]|nr:AbrB/MazE/SpoVT family DNA-binding domain-containing protein [Ignavibacteriales bacterium]